MLSCSLLLNRGSPHLCMEWSSTVVYYDELTVGEVIRFDNRSGRMYGWIKITEGDAEDIGTTIWFHYNDGEFLSAYDSSVEWATSVHYGTGEVHLAFANNPRANMFDASRLRLPRVGDEIVFEQRSNHLPNEKLKATPWTYARYFREQALRSSSPYRIIREDDVVLWEGYYLHEHGVLGTSGNLPRELDDSMRLEWLAPDDIAEAIHPSHADIIVGYPIPGGWGACEFSEELWKELVAARPFEAA
jgi:hypothetical protein